MSRNHCEHPCQNCPFLKRSSKHLLNDNEARKVNALPSFACKNHYRSECAGHMLMHRHKNIYMNISRRLGFTIILTGQDQIFSSVEDMYNHYNTSSEKAVNEPPIVHTRCSSAYAKRIPKRKSPDVKDMSPLHKMIYGIQTSRKEFESEKD